MRRHTPRTTPTLDLLRRHAARLEAALDAAAPDKAPALLDRMTKLAVLLAEAEKREAEKPSNDDLVAQRAAFDAEVERLIALRAEERALFMLNPPDWELENRARRISGEEGGAWPDYMERVKEEQAGFIRGLAEAKRNSSKVG